MANLHGSARLALVMAVVGVSSASGVSAAVSPAAPDRGAQHVAAAADDPAFTIEHVSVQADGRIPRRASWAPAITPDGRYVAFISKATGLDPSAGRTHHNAHVYVRDLEAGVTTAVDVRPDGTFGHGSGCKATYSTYGPVLSDDGRYVAFNSDSRALAPGGRRSTYDLFVRDLVAGETSLVSLTANGGPANADAFNATLSGDGTTLAFTSGATNIVPGRERRHQHVYLRDLETGVVSLASKTPTGDFPDDFSHSPSLSGDGSLLAYRTASFDVVPGFRGIVLYDAVSDTSVIASKPDSGSGQTSGNDPDVSADGSTVVFESTDNIVLEDRTHWSDIFAYDVATGSHTLVSRTAAGEQTNGNSVDADAGVDGTLIAYSTWATKMGWRDRNLSPDVFSAARDGGSTILRSQARSGATANRSSQFPSVAATGAIAFMSEADNIVDGLRTQVGRIYVSHPG